MADDPSGLNKDFQSYSPDNDCLYLKAFSEMEGIGPTTLWRLLNEAGSPAALWKASRSFLSLHLPQKKREAFILRQAAGLPFRWLESHQEQNIMVIAYTDNRYPKLLKEIHHPPFLLYATGDITIMNTKTIAVVGTRNATEYGRQVTEKLVSELKPWSVSIVSGLAAGIDTFAHWAAIGNGLPTLAIYGCGLDIVYPASNQQLSREIITHGGLLISEYPLGTRASRSTFPQRNRIVAGLSHGVLMIEGGQKSGALITARIALEEGRSVFVVPGNIFSSSSQGSFQLLQNGAVPVSCGEHITRDLNWWVEAPLKPYRQFSERGQDDGNTLDDSTQKCLSELSDEGDQLLKSISFDPLSIENLQQTTGFASAKINEILTILELEGLIVLLPGANVCRR